MVETAEGHYNNQIMIETLTKFKQTKLQRLESYLSSVLPIYAGKTLHG